MHSERLRAFRNTLEMSQSDMAEKLEMNPRTYSNYENGRLPPQDVLSDLARIGLNLNWHLTGEGPMRRGEAEEAQPSDGATTVQKRPQQRVELPQADPMERRRPNALKEVPLAPEDIEEAHFVPYFDAPVGAGSAGGNVQLVEPQGYVAFRAEWLRDHLRIPPARAFVAEVSGISMRGLLDDRDLVIGEFVEEIPRQDLCVVAYDDDLLVKHLEREPGGEIRLRSENDRYSDILVEPGIPFYFVGCVRGHVSRV
jgi:phage repressor protein C with HTH and peptisase S24 domain